MKNVFKITLSVLALFLTGLTASAKEKDTATVRFFLNAGGSVWSHFSINQKFENGHGNLVNTFAPEIGFGFLADYKRFQYYLEIDATFNQNKKGNIPYQFGYASVDLGARYAVARFSHQAVYLGLEASLLPMTLDLLPRNSTVDLNNISPITQSGEVNLYATPLLFGPALASGDLFPKSSFNMNVAVSYQINLIQSKWRSKYADVLNSPKENGSRFKVSILFPFN